MINRCRAFLLVFATLLAVSSAPRVFAQEPEPIPAPPNVLEPTGVSGLGLFNLRNNPGYLTGTHDFDGFIGYISSPIQAIDPRAVTEIWPMFGAAWASGGGRFFDADANAQIYGAGLYLALSDRFSVGINQGGYGVVHINGQPQPQLANLGLPVPDRKRAGQREGWLNLGGFAQYMLIADVEHQFILTAGMRWEAPSGATQVFQGGANPTYLAPYLTVGKEFGNWHILALTGFEFPAGTGTAVTSTYYFNLHLDRQIGWLYPLVELHGSFRTVDVDLNLPIRHGVLDMGGFSSTGSVVTFAAGASAVLVPGKLELGAVYYRPITSRDQLDANGLLVKMTYRY